MFFVYLQNNYVMNEDFETYYIEVISCLDNSILPQTLHKAIEEELREYIYVLYYKGITDLTAATVVSAFLSTFKKYLIYNGR